MEKHEHVITLSTGSKERVDQFILTQKSKLAVTVLGALLSVDSIDKMRYAKELKTVYNKLGIGNQL